MKLSIATLQEEELAYEFVCELEEHVFPREVFHHAWKESMDDDTIHHYF